MTKYHDIIFHALCICQIRKTRQEMVTCAHHIRTDPRPTCCNQRMIFRTLNHTGSGEHTKHFFIRCNAVSDDSMHFFPSLTGPCVNIFKFCTFLSISPMRIHPRQFFYGAHSDDAIDSKQQRGITSDAITVYHV